MDFTAQRAKALKPGEHLIVPDAPGLRLVATDTKRTWTYRYKSPANGAMRQLKLGSWPAMGLPAALAAWHPVKTARDDGADPAAEKRARRAEAAGVAAVQALTVRKVCNTYLAWLQQRVTAKTHGEAKRLFDRELDSIADRPAASITRADAFAVIEAKVAAPVVGVMLRQYLGAAWDHALDAGELAPDVPNWWRLVLRGKLVSRGKTVEGKKVGTAKRSLSVAEVGQLLRWLPNYTRDMDDALTLYLFTCCRGVEIVAMERGEITEEPTGWWWTIPVAKLKMRRNPLLVDLRVPLVGRAEAIVRRRLQSTEGSWLFPSHSASGHIEQKAVGVAVWAHGPRCKSRPEWVRPRCPVDRWSPHDLRRTGRTMLTMLRCPSDVAEAVLGHMQPGIEATYNLHTYDAERREWLTKLAAHYEACAAG